MTLLSMVQFAAVECNLSAPLTVVGNTDQNVIQLYGFIRREGEVFIKRGLVQEVTEEVVLPALAQEDQGDIRTLAPGYEFMVPNSFWNRTTRRQFVGPVTNDRWQEIQAVGIGSLDPVWRLRGDTLLVHPIPTVSDSLAFEYYSNYWIENNAGTAKASFTADDDVSRIDEEVLTMGAVWRWLKSKGLDYAEERRDYEIVRKNFMLRNNSMETVMGGDYPRRARGDYFAVDSP